MFKRKRLLLSKIYSLPDKYLNNKIIICGWIHNIRKQPPIAFIQLNDGSCQSNLQVVCSPDYTDTKLYQSILDKGTRGVSIKVYGKLVLSTHKSQKYEVQAESIHVYGNVNATRYPIPKKKFNLEYIRKFEHMRIRTQTISAVMRIRNTLAKETHNFFQLVGCKYVNTPILTTNDCEGAGECFTVTSQYPKNEKPVSLYKRKELFKKPVFLSVSGQLHGESYAMGLGDIYTFGPTFRAENSNTSRHLCEFWMIEPELCFIDMDDLQNLSEAYIKHCINSVLKENGKELEFLSKLDTKYSLLFTLERICNNEFIRISYTDAIDILLKEEKEFVEPVSWGIDLSSEHEKYLTDVHFKLPTIVYDYPKKIKSFYMKVNEDNITVQAMDLLVPQIGELIGGSMREDNYDKLKTIMEEKGIKDLEWYLDLRKFGSVPHGGFGLGFERLVQLCTGMKNIRDVIPYPRFPKHCNY